jgi:flagellar biogenesis protein FliO
LFWALPSSGQNSGSALFDGSSENTLNFENGSSENTLSRKFSDYSEPPIKNDIDFYKLLFKMFFATVFVVAIILAIFVFLSKKGSLIRNRNMSLLDQFQFAPGKFVYLVEIYGKLFILGVSGDNITMISEITSIEEKRYIKLEVSQKKKIKKFDELIKENMEQDL